MRTRFSIFSLLAIGLIFFSSCKKGIDYVYYTEKQQSQLSTALNMPSLPDDYLVELPLHLSRNGLFARPSDNTKAALGRVIFYDKSLSSDGKVSCASCHLQDHGFGDPKALSTGVNDRQSARNSIALGSVVNFSAYYGTDINGPSAIRFFWDNRAETVEQQSRGAFTNPDEMNMHMTDVVNAIKSKDYYEPLFQKAFAKSDEADAKPFMSEANIFAAVSDFINSMGSYRSKFDQEADKLYTDNFGFGVDLIANTFAGFTPEENAGKAIYLRDCASCHSNNMGRPSLNFANNGLDAVYTDKGVGGISNNPYELYQFKVPTLRNIVVSAPYMHDGRFATLEQVIDHYSTGIQMNDGLSGQLRVGNSARKFNYSASEKQQLIAFLHTVTDTQMANDVRFANPFK